MDETTQRITRLEEHVAKLAELVERQSKITGSIIETFSGLLDKIGAVRVKAHFVGGQVVSEPMSQEERLRELLRVDQ